MKVPPPGGVSEKDSDDVEDSKDDRRTENFEDVCTYIWCSGYTVYNNHEPCIYKMFSSC